MDLIAHKLKSEISISHDMGRNGSRIMMSPRELRRNAETLVRAFCNAESNISLVLEGVDPLNGAPLELKEDFSSERIFKYLGALPQTVTNFLESCLDSYDSSEPKAVVAVLAGPGFSHPILRSLVRTVFKAKGYLVSEDTVQAVLKGLHRCVQILPKLPYDCGFVIKKPGDDMGIGMLVLTRSTSIGEQRETEEIRLPAAEHSSVEIAFYVRRLDLDNEQIHNEVMKSHVFAPQVDSQGCARIKIGMSVTWADDSERLVSVTILIHDLVGEKIIRLGNLPVVGGKPMLRPPLRNADTLKGIAWIFKIIQAMRVLSSQEDEIGPWREVLERPAVSIPFQEYRRILIEIAIEISFFEGEINNETLLIHFREPGIWIFYNNFVNEADPAQIQSVLRALLFDAMQTLARRVTQEPATRGYCEQWLIGYPSANVPRDAGCAQELLNSVSQDTAGLACEDKYISRVRELPNYYGWTCSAPERLNIDW